MSGRLPGDGLRAFLAHFVEPKFQESTIDPTIADLQLELHRTKRPSWRRWAIRARYVVALGRLLACHPGGWNQPLKRIIGVVLLGGAGLAGVVRSQANDAASPTWLVPFIVVALATPVVFRVFRLGETYGQMFANCAGVFALMTLSSLKYSHRFLEVPPRIAALGIALLAGCFLFGSALAAAASIGVANDRDARVHRAMLALFAGFMVFALAGLALLAAAFLDARLASVVIFSNFYVAFIFSMVAAVVILPPLLIADRLLKNRAIVLALSILLSPIPLLIFPMRRTFAPMYVLRFVLASFAIALVLTRRPAKAPDLKVRGS